MTVSLKHAFTSAVADGGDTSLVQPSNWNAEHNLTMATARLLGRTTAGTGSAEEISAGTGLSLSAGTLAVGATTPQTNASNTFTSNQIIEVTDNTNAALRITQLGTGAAIRVEDSANPDSTPFMVDANGNVIIGGNTTAFAPLDIGPANGADEGGEVRLRGATNGTQDYYIDVFGSDMRFVKVDKGTAATNAAVRFQIGSSGQFGVGGANYGTSGQIMISGGASAAPSWSSTLTNPTLTGFTETVYAVSGTTPALSPNNGTVQTWTLTGSSTPTAGTWASGQSITLMVDDGTAYTITWTSLPVTWVGGSAPTLATTGYTIIELWKVSTTIYGALVGTA